MMRAARTTSLLVARTTVLCAMLVWTVTASAEEPGVMPAKLWLEMYNDPDHRHTAEVYIMGVSEGLMGGGRMDCVGMSVRTVASRTADLMNTRQDRRFDGLAFGYVYLALSQTGCTERK